MTIPWPRFISSVDQEPIAILFLRVSVGAILIYREFFNAVAAFLDPELSSKALEPVFYCAVGGLLLAGAGTRLWYLILSAFYVHYNFRLEIMNLGPLLLVPLCWAGLALDRNPLYSVDRKLMARSATYRRLAQWPDVNVSVDTYNFVFGILLFIYAVNSLGALANHLRDPYWTDGQTVHAMLTNNFLSRYWETFRWIEAQWPGVLDNFSAASVIVQTFFQASILLLVYFYWGRWFVVLQGFAFFLFTFAFLQLSILPAVEIVTWTLVFGRWIGDSRRRSLNVRLSLTPARGAILALLTIASAISVGNNIARAMGKEIGHLGSSIERAIIHLSIWPPDVFNAVDLRMGEHWYVIYRASGPGANQQLVPVFSEAGSRMYYHRADVVYFANTLRWRRSSISVTDWQSSVPGYLTRLVKRVCAIDFRLNNFAIPQQYSVYVYRDRSMQLDLPPAERYEKRLVLTTAFEIGR